MSFLSKVYANLEANNKPTKAQIVKWAYGNCWSFDFYDYEESINSLPYDRLNLIFQGTDLEDEVKQNKDEW